MAELQVPTLATKQRPKTSSTTKPKAAKHAKSKAKQLPVLSTSNDMQSEFTAADRLHMISVAAYYRAEHSGFAPDRQWQDWFDAEKSIDAMLHKKK